MILIIAGGRDFNDFNYMFQCMYEWCLTHEFPTEIIEGGANGADTLGRRWAELNNIKCVTIRADWKQHGKSAGPKRNHEMAKLGKALVAFWDGKSPGTKNMIGWAEFYGRNVMVFWY